MYAGVCLFDSKTTSSIIAPISTKQATDSSFSQKTGFPQWWWQRGGRQEQKSSERKMNMEEQCNNGLYGHIGTAFPFVIEVYRWLHLNFNREY